MKIGIERDDGGLTVMTLVDGLGLEDVPREIAKWEQGTGYKAVRWEEITEYPPRLYRNAYELGDKQAVVNMEKARNLHRDELRIARKPMLEELDVAYVRADETGDAAQKASIASDKTVLRDVTEDPRIEAAQTPEELAQLTLDTLIGSDTVKTDGG